MKLGEPRKIRLFRAVSKERHLLLLSLSLHCSNLSLLRSFDSDWPTGLYKYSAPPELSAFGCEVDYAMLIKTFESTQEETRYSPAKCVSCESKVITGNPDPKHISTSFVERHNWTVRTAMRRYTRLSNGFSRKVENHAAAVALNYFAYNFIQIHRTLRTSPAMAAGVTDRLWSVDDLVALWESEERRRERAA